jgi:uracil-DNA glycosylase family 4
MGILIVGEAPGATEDEQGIPFCGKAGAYLEEVLESIGIDLRRDCWITNSLICRPPDNATPTDAQIEYCQPNLIKTVTALKPRVVITLGGKAVQSLMGWVWRGDDIGGVGKWAGWKIPCQKPNMWICPTYHPSYLLREHSNVLDKIFKKHLETAFACQGVPWPELPDYKSQVEVILDTDIAAEIIRKITAKGGPCAFDYENTCLKPEYEGGEAVCASICWRGKKTIAYPWHGEAIEASREFLASPNTFKIASNLKHEDRWTRKMFGHGVRGWLWDTMLAAHVLDNREGGICGLKFQAFVVLGAQSYDDAIKQFLRTKKDRKINQVKEEVEIHQLLGYCGMDTLLEYKVAEVQMEKMENLHETYFA